MRPEITALSFVVLPLLLLPLPPHIKGRNVALITLALTLFLVNMIRGVNSIVWADNVVVKWEMWCDITTKFIIGAQVAIPACTFCITRHLDRVASICATVQHASDKRRRQIFETCLCIIFPCIIMALHYVVQGHRFDIGEDFGLTAFCWFSKRRAQFADHLQRGRSGLSIGRYTRLMGMAITEILISDGYGMYVYVIAQRNSPLRVWDNWTDVHSNFSRVGQFPKAYVPEEYWNNVEMTWFAVTLGSLAFFCFFGFGEEAISEYRRLCDWFRLLLFRRRAENSILPTVSRPPRVTDSVNLKGSNSFDGRAYDLKMQSRPSNFFNHDIQGLDPVVPLQINRT